MGTIFSPDNFNDVYLVQVDAAGNKVWEKQVGSQRLDTGFSIQQTSDGVILLPAGLRQEAVLITTSIL